MIFFSVDVTAQHEGLKRYLYVARSPKDRDGFHTLRPSLEVHDIQSGLPAHAPVWKQFIKTNYGREKACGDQFVTGRQYKGK